MRIPMALIRSPWTVLSPYNFKCRGPKTEQKFHYCFHLESFPNDDDMKPSSVQGAIPSATSIGFHCVVAPILQRLVRFTRQEKSAFPLMESHE